MSTTEQQLSGKVAIVTGAGRCIGKAIARAYARAGAAVCCAAHTEAYLRATVQDIVAAGGQGLAVPTDVTQLATVQQPHGITGLLVQLDQVFHPGDALGIRRGDAPWLLEPWLERVFFSTRRTVTEESSSTMPTSTIRSANHRKLQRSRPMGGVLQARAIRWAAWRPSRVRRAPGRGRSYSAASSSPVRYCLPVRVTITAEVCSMATMVAAGC